MMSSILGNFGLRQRIFVKESWDKNKLRTNKFKCKVYDWWLFGEWLTGLRN